MACRSKRGGLNRSTPTRPKQSAQEKAATTSFTASAYWKFESSPLQRRVGCELGYCKGGPAASFRGRHKRVRDSNAAPHSDDVRTGSTAVDADGQSEHVFRGAAGPAQNLKAGRQVYVRLPARTRMTTCVSSHYDICNQIRTGSVSDFTMVAGAMT